MYFTVTFSNKADYREGHPQTPAEAGPFDEFIQITYTDLRAGPGGVTIADMKLIGEHAACWRYNGNWYSDIVIEAGVG